jgi:outer membrane protein TolC
MARLALFIVATLLTLPTLASAADDQDLPKQLTLSQAITIALANNSILRAAQSRLEQAAGRYTQSRSSLLPQLELDARQGYLTINLVGLGIDIPSVSQGKTGPFASMDARLLLSQDLLNIANRQAWKSAHSRQESSRLPVDNAREIVVLDVVATYLQALKAKASLATLEEQGKLATDLYNLTGDRVKQGVAAPLEANREQQQVNSLKQQQEAEESYIAAKLSLANALQKRITSDFDVDDTTAYGTDTNVDRDSAFQSALASRPDYLSLQANVKAAELRLKSVKAYRLPIATASFSDRQSGATPASNVNTYRLTGLVCVSGCSRSRDHDYSQPPPQIRTSGFPASGLPQVMTPGRRGGKG